MSNDDIAISVKNVHKEFVLNKEQGKTLKKQFISFFKPSNRHQEQKQKVLNGVTFDIKKGEFFGIVGRNGSGKSTLLKIISEIYQPTTGTVKINGKLVSFIELGVGFNQELSGRDNVYLNGALLGRSRKQIEKDYDKIVEFAELQDHMDKKLKNYSSGMQVRLAFACATVVESDILIVDEVLAVGDEAFQRKCENYFRTLKNNKKTVVLVTHSMDSVKEYCDRAIMIHKGKIVIDGNSEQVANEYSVENTKTLSSHGVQEKNKISEILSDVRVTLLSKPVISEKDLVKVQIEYKISKNLSTSIYVNLIDINRGFSLNAGSCVVPATKDGYVKREFNISINQINDASIQLAVSICDQKAGVCVYLPSDILPTFILRRSDYPDPNKRATYAVMFDRGSWKDENIK